MKKKVISVLVVCMMLVGLLFPGSVVSAKSNENANVKFYGSITPNRNFYYSEYPSYNDFNITGLFIDKTDGSIIPSSEWKIFVEEPILTDKVKITLKHLPSFETEQYSDISYTLTAEVKDFSANLLSDKKNKEKVNVNDGNINTVSINYYNSVGQTVAGDTQYSYGGDNLINYSFIPSKYVEAYNQFYNYNIYHGQLSIDKIDFPILTADYVEVKKGQKYDINIKNKIKGSSYDWHSEEPTNVSVNCDTGLTKAESLGKSMIYCDITLPTGNILTLRCYVVVK